jgi:hypothetical protein
MAKSTKENHRACTLNEEEMETTARQMSAEKIAEMKVCVVFSFRIKGFLL